MNDLTIVLNDTEALTWLQAQLPLTTTQTDLANAWGWNDMRVSRQLSRWEDAGLIARQGSRPVTITIPLTEVTQVLTSVTSADQRSNNPTFPSGWRFDFTGFALTLIAIALAGVGLSINAWFARSLGATDFAGWLFLAMGLAVESAALILPRHAVSLWSRRELFRATLSWLLWSLTFAFALVASVGFASLNVADITATRAARTTPAIDLAHRVADTITKSREAECLRRGPLCRALEADERQALTDLTSAHFALTSAADPQSTRAAELIAWLTRGSLRPDTDDLAKLRLALFTLLPQIGGLLLMLAGRR